MKQRIKFKTRSKTTEARHTYNYHLRHSKPINKTRSRGAADKWTLIKQHPPNLQQSNYTQHNPTNYKTQPLPQQTTEHSIPESSKSARRLNPREPEPTMRKNEERKRLKNTAVENAVNWRRRVFQSSTKWRDSYHENWCCYHESGGSAGLHDAGGTGRCCNWNAQGAELLCWRDVCSKPSVYPEAVLSIGM